MKYLVMAATLALSVYACSQAEPAAFVPHGQDDFTAPFVPDPALCAHGRPLSRRRGITYGGLRPRHGFERDHCVPLGLGGPDDPLNVWYQPWQEARRKDEIEKQMIEAYCRGNIGMAQAWAVFDGKCHKGGW